VISIRSRHSRRALATHLSAIAFARGALDRRPDDPGTGRREDRIECRGELGVPVSDHELDAAGLVLESHHQVACLLGNLCRSNIELCSLS
jgi:hypothetical protein